MIWLDPQDGTNDGYDLSPIGWSTPVDPEFPLPEVPQRWIHTNGKWYFDPQREVFCTTEFPAYVTVERVVQDPDRYQGWADWLASRGRLPITGSSITIDVTLTQESNMNNRNVFQGLTPERRAAQLRRRAERLEAEAERLESMPKEPVIKDDPTPVIFFGKTFGGEKVYTFAAVKATNGNWYVTGDRSPQDLTWDRLVEWIYQDEPEDPEILVGTKWNNL